MTAHTAGLAAVFLTARLILLTSLQEPLSITLVLAWFWQDLAVLATFAIGERFLRAKWIWHLAYWVLVVISAFNVPVARELGSPLTAALLRAARGTLADSIRHHATATNLVICGALLLIGALVPWLVRRRRADHLPRIVWVLPVVVLALVGRWAASQADTRGLEWNPLVAIVRTAVPRVGGTMGLEGENWRTPVFKPESTAPRDSSLASLRGTARGKNVLLVMLESVGATHLRSYGASIDPAPNFTRLAERGIVFENAYTVYPESVRGLVTFLSSRYPGFDIANARHAVIASPSLASELTGRGYHTALFHSGRFMYLGMDELLARTGFTLLEDAGHIGGNHNSSFGIDEAAAVKRILSWLDSIPRGGNFFAAYLPIAGHHPYTFQPPSPFPPGADVDNYHSAIFDADRALGVLLDGLRARGLDTNTVVIVASDHAEAFGEHPGNYGHTLAVYEENVRVPFLIALPGSSAVTARITQPVSLLDLAPTTLDLLGIELPRQFQGSSLLNGKPAMPLFFTDYSLGVLGARDGCMKFIHEMQSGRSRLFDLCNDPGERNDISSAHPNEVRALRERVDRWMSAQVWLIRER